MERQKDKQFTEDDIIFGIVFLATLGLAITIPTLSHISDSTQRISNPDGVLEIYSRENTLYRITHKFHNPLSETLIDAYRISWVDWDGINIVNLQAINESAQSQALNLISQRCTVLQTIDQDKQNGILRQYLKLGDPACLKNFK